MTEDADRDEAERKRERRTGRGRLTSLEQLPEEAQEDVTWARLELGKRERTQADILHEFNGRLADKSLEPVSKSAFNRASVRLAAMNKRLSEARAFYDSMGVQSPDKVDEQGAVLGEMIKLLIFDLVQEEGADLGPKGAKELADAHLSVIRASTISADRRRKLEADFKAQAAAEVGKVADKLGLSPEVRRDLNAELFGVAPPKPRAALP